MESYEDNMEMSEFLEQINFALSMEFKSKWRHRFSDHFIDIFQVRVLKALKDRKPLKRSTLVTLFTKKHKYGTREVSEFFSLIDISLYHPFIYNDRG